MELATELATAPLGGGDTMPYSYFEFVCLTLKHHYFKCLAVSVPIWTITLYKCGINSPLILCSSISICFIIC